MAGTDDLPFMILIPGCKDRRKVLVLYSDEKNDRMARTASGHIVPLFPIMMCDALKKSFIPCSLGGSAAISFWT